MTSDWFVEPIEPGGMTPFVPVELRAKADPELAVVNAPEDTKTVIFADGEGAMIPPVPVEK